MYSQSKAEDVREGQQCELGPHWPWVSIRKQAMSGLQATLPFSSPLLRADALLFTVSLRNAVQLPPNH